MLNNLIITLTILRKIYFQVTSKKRKIKYDLPLQIGFFVYQYAKLRMLQFYYDVVDRFIDRADFEVLEMDTGKTAGFDESINH